MHEQTQREIGASQSGDSASQFKPGEMNGEFAEQLSAVADVVNRFALVPLEPAVRACHALYGNEPIDLAVLGQFKSGKSSLLNAVLGESVLPVGVLPLTAVITRIADGTQRLVQVTYTDGRVEEVALTRLAEYVTEAGNPGNQRRVAVVDVLLPAMRDLPGVRLVDTPGLGSVFAHNTEATRAWMPNVAAAMVAVSAERPLSEEDVRLVSEARQTAPRVIVILTKVDLLTDAERELVIDFLESRLHDEFDTEITVMPFSVKVETQRWLNQLHESLFLLLTRNVLGERRAALLHKLNAVSKSCRDYLTVGIQAAERNDADRERLRAAVLNEKVGIAVIQDELALAEQGICASLRPAFEKYFLGHRLNLRQRMSQALDADLPSWQGNLAKQTLQLQSWMQDRLLAELTPLSADAVSVASGLTERAELRFRRIVEAFRDRLNRNIHEAMGITVSALAWEAVQPDPDVIPVDVGHAFMIHWELLWWLLPMKLVGGMFRRHALRQVEGEVEKNLRRLVSDWTKAADQAVGNLRSQAARWVDMELGTLNGLLQRQSTELIALREALCSLECVA